MRSPLFLLLPFLALNGCILPSQTETRGGEMLIEKRDLEVEELPELEVSYAYPDIRASFQRNRRTTWRERLGTRVVEGGFSYNPIGDMEEIVTGPVLFVGGLFGLARDTVTLDYERETFDRLLHLVTTVPLLHHRDNASVPDQYNDTGKVNWRTWHEKHDESRSGLRGKTINFLDAEGIVLFQAVTNENGEAFVDIRDAYTALFQDGRKPVRAQELVSGKSVEFNLDLQKIRTEAARVGEDELFAGKNQ